MKKIILLFILSLVFISCKQDDKVTSKENNSTTEKPDFAIVIHGGAGTILKKNMTTEKEIAYKTVLKKAIETGFVILKNGGSSLDAVTKTINVMEDSPLFNAGKGAVFTNTGTNELDASIMDGKTLNAGASAGTTTVKNPIDLARAIMDNSPHVMLSGKGADAFAIEQELDIVDSRYFYTEERFKTLKRIQNSEKSKLEQKDKTAYYDPEIKDSKFGTVGCVALDKNGNLAAGTSSGGMTNKRWGRIGDVPIIGAGTYANNATCAVSSTGWGEYFIRATVAHDISALMEYKGMSLKKAAYEVIHNKVDHLGGNGGVVAVDKNGKMVFEFNTEGMYRASMNSKGELVVEIYNQN